MALGLRKSWTMKAAVANPEVLCLALLSCVLTLLPAFVPIGGGLLTALAPFPLIVLAVEDAKGQSPPPLSLQGRAMPLGGRGGRPLQFRPRCPAVLCAPTGP